MLGRRQVGKARGFGPRIRGFKSYRPSQMHQSGPPSPASSAGRDGGRSEKRRGMAQGDLKILTGTSNPALATAICDHLGCTLLPAKVGTFSDGEIRVEIGANVRGCDIYVVPVHLYPGQLQPHGAVPDPRRAPACQRPACHGGGALFRLRPARIARSCPAPRSAPSSSPIF